LRDADRSFDREQEVIGVNGELSDMQFHSSLPILAYSRRETITRSFNGARDGSFYEICIIQKR
jgi:hypothetical protein